MDMSLDKVLLQESRSKSTIKRFVMSLLVAFLFFIQANGPLLSNKMKNWIKTLSTHSKQHLSFHLHMNLLQER